MWLSCYNRLDYHIFNILEELVHINPHLSILLPECSETPFATSLFIRLVKSFALIAHKSGAVLIDRVVSEMDVSALDGVAALRVFLSSKASEPFFVEVYFKWIEASHQNVEPQVIFEAIDKMGVDVFRNYHSASFINSRVLVDDLDSSSTR